MSLKDKIKNIWSILNRYFIMPFLISISSLFILISILKLKVFNTDNSIILYTGLIFGFLTFFLWFKKLEKESNVRKYIFKFSKSLFIINLFLIFFLRLKFLLKFQLSININQWLIFTTILIGFIILYSSREVFEEDEKDNSKKLLNEENKIKNFSHLFPKINKIPLLRNIVKWMYKEGWFYSITVFLSIIIGFILRLYNLGKLGLWWDEIITGTYVTRILEIGTPLFPSGLGFYWRGIAYHYFVSVFNFLFGNTEFWLRFPSVLFGMGIILLIFYYAKKIDKITALFILVFLVFSSYNIEYSRFARFYIMNAFLFTLSILIFYKGFFEEKIKYKFFSVAIFFIMIHTVQAGSIFLSLVGAWSLFHLKDILITVKSKISLIKKNVINYLFIITFFIIFYLDNIFYRFIKIVSPYKTSQELNLAIKPPSWDYFSIPKFELFNFFNENYISIGIIIISFLTTIFIFIYNKSNKIKEFTFTIASLFIAIIMYEIGNRGILGPRLYIFYEALIIMLILISLNFILKIYFKNIKLVYISLAIISFLIMINIHPYFYERINIKYGDSVILDPFRTTEVAAYRADYKNTSLFIKNTMKNNDILITVMVNNYFDTKLTPDYIFNQNLQWNTDSFVNDNGKFINPETGAILINNVSDIEEILKQNNKTNTYLLVNGGSVNILSTTHIRKDFIYFLEQNTDKEIFKSEDNYSKILLFKP